MKVIAFYLPQFHEIPQNSKWWGEGFTDWVNVKKAKKLFFRHNQPRKPLNDNYYDLSDIEVMKWQSKIAQEHGIYGFCYYHYWFNGKLLLEKPLENMLQNKEVTIPFCFSWANEPWTRAWDGGEKDILMPQSYGGKKEWKEHFDYLLQFFKDERYIKQDNKPMLLIYRTESIPNVNEMFDYWENLAIKSGFAGIYLVETLNSFQNLSFVKKSAALVEFEPLYTFSNKHTLLSRIVNKIYRKIFYNGLVIKNHKIWDTIIKREPFFVQSKQIIAGAFVDWDNSARKSTRGVIFKNATVKKFKYYFTKQFQRANKIYKSEYIFINAWNEWAEGTYLEPDNKNKYGYLEVIKDIMKDN